MLNSPSDVQAMERAIAAHLFVIAPNNSGSTYLRKALATSSATWNLPHDGQRMAGFVGPVTWKSFDADGERPGLLWAAHERWLEKLASASLYDWPRTRRAWYFQATSQRPDASVFVAKSPPFLLVVDALAHHFHNARFLFMVRNPYAVCEGICRAYGKERGVADLPTRAATHVATCMVLQRANIETHASQGVFFHYETLCAEPERVAEQVTALVPELDGLDLRQRLSVKSYHETLTNMNERQIARLSAADLAAINSVFRRHRSTLDYFGYGLLRAGQPPASRPVA